LPRRFVELIEVELAPAAFVRRGPVFRYFVPSGNGIVLDVQRDAEQLSTGQWRPGRWPDGQWNANVLRAYAHAEHGDPDAVVAEIAGWHWHAGGPVRSPRTS
jgi:hypothetical protein